MAQSGQGYKGSDDYIASKPLMEIVNVAIALGKPLVIKGDPGTGKTLLAHSIANALKKKCPEARPFLPIASPRPLRKSS